MKLKMEHMSNFLECQHSRKYSVTVAKTIMKIFLNGFRYRKITVFNRTDRYAHAEEFNSLQMRYVGRRMSG